MADQTPEPTIATNEQRLDFLRLKSSHARAKAEISGAHRAEVKRARNSGINDKAGAFVHMLRGLALDEARDHLMEVFKFAWAAEIVGPDQLELLGRYDPRVTNSAMVEWRVSVARENGWQSGLDGNPPEDNPHTVSSEEFVAWEQERQRAATAKKAELGTEGEQAPGERAQPPGRDVHEADEQPKRGRKAKRSGATIHHFPLPVDETPPTPKPRRGRPPKAQPAEPKRKRGRAKAAG